jgi:hypothetical protein
MFLTQSFIIMKIKIEIFKLILNYYSRIKMIKWILLNRQLKMTD